MNSKTISDAAEQKTYENYITLDKEKMINEGKEEKGKERLPLKGIKAHEKWSAEILKIEKMSKILRTKELELELKRKVE